MGRGSRWQTWYLAEKLLSIREGLGLSQNGLIQKMKAVGLLKQNDISAFEHSKREPPLAVILKYARLIGGRRETGKYLEMLADRDMKLRLPKHLLKKSDLKRSSSKGRSTLGKKTKR